LLNQILCKLPIALTCCFSDNQTGRRHSGLLILHHSFLNAKFENTAGDYGEVGLTRSRTFSQPEKNSAQRNNPCSVHPLYARHCTPSSLVILQGHLPDQGKREGQGLRRPVNSIPSAEGLSVEAKFLVGSQVEARALRGHRGLPAGQSGGGIVGEDDGGKLFTPEEYEEYKRKVLPMRLQNRLFVSWRSPTGMDCKLVGPETLCFCTHRYKQHKTDFETIPQQRPISLPCQVTGCPCRAYLYVTLNGMQPIRCRCKHFADQHSSQCSGFHSCFTCACGQPAYAHYTVVETKQERLAQRKPVGRDVPYAAMGGLTGFSSLAEDYMRLDDSGIGAPSGEFLDSPVTAMDHPFLKAFQASSSSSPETLTDGTSSQVSSLRKPEEDDMAFFERRYQERELGGKAVVLPWNWC
ncbi:hypothetical protein EI555_010580, partial [Monodon monoceros]